MKLKKLIIFIFVGIILASTFLVQTIMALPEDIEDQFLANGTDKVHYFYIDKGTINFYPTNVIGYDASGNQKTVDYSSDYLYVITQTPDTISNNSIIFNGNQNPYQVLLKNIHLKRTYNGAPTQLNPGDGYVEENKTGMIMIDGYKNTSGVYTKKVSLYLSGENILNGIRYSSGIQTDYSTYNYDSYLEIDSSICGTENGQLYIPEKVNKENIEAFVSSNTNYNHFNAGIGGTDVYQFVNNLKIKGGTLQVLTTRGDNCTAIGGGGNGIASIDIEGGNITAVCNGTGTALGGGIGYVSSGGDSNIKISNAKIFAANLGIIESDALTIGGVAIGGGSSFYSIGSSANIEINNSTIEAYAKYGNGIGSGNSAQQSTNDATITINSGTIQTNALGGGSSEQLTGGNAFITMNGGSLTCQKIETYIGSFGIGGGTSKNGSGGNATVIVTGGNLNCNDGTIGGGTSKEGGNGGNASISISGGTLVAGNIGDGNAEDSNNSYDGGDAAINVSAGLLDCSSIGGGKSIKGKPGAVSSTDCAGLIVSGGTLKTGTIGGGTNSLGDIGFATILISGGNIQGQFILANNDETKRCTFTMTGGTINNANLGTGKYQKAQNNGGAVYLSDPNGQVEISGGTIQNCVAQLGGAIYMSAGDFILSKNTESIGQIIDCKANLDGGAVYIGNGNVLINGGKINNNVAQNNGGAVYIDKGEFKVLDGMLTNNKATTNNGGAVYIASGNIYMFGGSIESNQAYKDGGGLYISSSTSQANIIIRSGSISYNKALNGKGAGIAVVSKQNQPDSVIIGLCEEHPNIDYNSRTFDAFNYTDTIDHQTHNHATCPQMINNEASVDGGGIYMNSDNASLDIFCLFEEGNIVINNSDGKSLMASGGTVTIGDKDNYYGNVVIKTPMQVDGGNVILEGSTNNPLFISTIRVDIKDGKGSFTDNRINNGTQKYYKVHYFENFEDSGIYLARQYLESDTIYSLGTVYTHEGWKILGWNIAKDGTQTEYLVGNTIATNDDHSAWDHLPNTYNDALVLYAHWVRPSYTVEFNPNSLQYVGQMPDQVFSYTIEQTLQANNFKVVGQRFINWNTEPSGSGTTYAPDYNLSMMSSVDGETIILYAQWQTCTHLFGENPGVISYIANNNTLTEQCDCEGWKTVATIEAFDAYHDGSTHLATISQEKAFLYGALTIEYLYSTDDTTYNPITTQPISVGYYRAYIEVNGQRAYINYQIKSPTSGTELTSKIITGQVFTDFSGTSTLISNQNGTFTTNFSIINLNTDVYTTEPTITFTQNMPVNTKIILVENNNFYYYIFENSQNFLSLSQFKKMGYNTFFQYIPVANQSYSLIFDFYDVLTTNYLQDDFNILFTYPRHIDQISTTLAVEINEKKSYTLNVLNNTICITPSTDNDNIKYNYQQLIFDLSSTNLPTNALLTIEANGVITKTYMNSLGHFRFAVDKTISSVTLKLESDSVNYQDTTYNFDVKMYLGNALYTTIDPNIQTTLALKIEKKIQPSLKIEGTSKLFTLDDEILKVNVTMKNTEGYNITGIIQKKINGKYEGKFLETSISKGENNLLLGGITESGSYALFITISKDNRTIMQVPYYFIIK